MERSGTSHGDQSPGGGRAVPRSSHDSAAEIKEEEIEKGEGKKKREIGGRGEEREKRRER